MMNFTQMTQRLKKEKASIMQRIAAWPIWRTRLGARLRGWFGFNRRYGIRFNSGTKERIGFYYRQEAENWANEQPYVKNYVVFQYEPIDMNITREKAYSIVRDRHVA